MTYRINDIFYSLQGEGRNTGRAAVFIRFAGCNLRCPFCDTEFDSFREMSDEDIVDAIAAYPSRFVVLTGGEPTLQVDEAFVDLLHQHGYEVAMESNGTRPAPRNLDWLTVSPKRHGGEWYGKPYVSKEVWERQPDELKLVFDMESTPEGFLWAHVEFGLSNPVYRIPDLCYLQPCDTGNAQRNAEIVKCCVEYIKEDPRWRLSLQTHKLIGIL